MSDRPAILPRSLRPPLASIRRFFDTGNLLRFLVSMVLAFGLWAWVTYENDPETTRVLGGITVTLQDLENEFEVVGEPPTVDVTIQGPQSIVTPLERESVVASVDMADIDQPGAYELDVEVDVPSGVRVRDTVPDTIAVDIDQMSARDDVPVELLEPDDVPPNYQVGSIDADTDQIRVSGPARSLDLIARAEVPMEIAGRTTSFTDAIEPRIVDAEGNEVPGVQVEPTAVNVTITLDVRGQVRKVIPVIVGDDRLATGHELVRTTVLPTDEIVVDGPEDALANVFFVTTVPIDVTGWDDSRIVRDVELDFSHLPEDITLEDESVHVSVEIRQQVHQREMSDLPVVVMNAPTGTDVVLESETASVVLEGSRSAVEAIDPDDITVFINIGNAEPGEYEFELNVIVPAQVQYREIEPSSIDVVIEVPEDEDANDDE